MQRNNEQLKRTEKFRESKNKNNDSDFFKNPWNDIPIAKEIIIVPPNTPETQCLNPNKGQL